MLKTIFLTYLRHFWRNFYPTIPRSGKHFNLVSIIKIGPFITLAKAKIKVFVTYGVSQLAKMMNIDSSVVKDTVTAHLGLMAWSYSQVCMQGMSSFHRVFFCDFQNEFLFYCAHSKTRLSYCVFTLHAICKIANLGINQWISMVWHPQMWKCRYMWKGS